MGAIELRWAHLSACFYRLSASRGAGLSPSAGRVGGYFAGLDSGLKAALLVGAAGRVAGWLSTTYRAALSDFRWLVPVRCAVYLDQPLAATCGLI